MPAGIGQCFTKRCHQVGANRLGHGALHRPLDRPLRRESKRTLGFLQDCAEFGGEGLLAGTLMELEDRRTNLPDGGVEVVDGRLDTALRLVVDQSKRPLQTEPGGVEPLDDPIVQGAGETRIAPKVQFDEQK